jgi:transcriptional regulator with GAF, ATPase, and Fis domain
MDAADLGLDDLARLERAIVERAMEAAKWKVYGADGAAAALGLKPTTLASRLKKMGLTRPS